MAAVQHQPDVVFREMRQANALRDNALEQWGKIEPLLSGKQVILFLDYDGTLSPIVDQPDKAFMRDSMRPVLAEAANKFTTAIVTGRSKEKVYDFVRLDGVFYAGSHGFEIQGPRSMPVHCKVASSIRPTLERSAVALNARLRHVAGCEIEDNKFSMSVHYRKVAPESVGEVQAIVKEYASHCPEVALKHGKKVLELRPNVPWNKGSAVLWILEALGLDKRDDVFPLYLGDDVTDEDAFKALQGRCPTPTPPEYFDSETLSDGPNPATSAEAASSAYRGDGDDPATAAAAAAASGPLHAQQQQMTIAGDVTRAASAGEGVAVTAGESSNGKQQRPNGKQQQQPSCKQMGGLGILVKEEHDTERPQETSAHFSLRNPAEVESFLQMLVERLPPSSDPQKNQQRQQQRSPEKQQPQKRKADDLQPEQQQQQQQEGSSSSSLPADQQPTSSSTQAGSAAAAFPEVGAAADAEDVNLTAETEKEQQEPDLQRRRLEEAVPSTSGAAAAAAAVAAAPALAEAGSGNALFQQMLQQHHQQQQEVDSGSSASQQQQQTAAVTSAAGQNNEEEHGRAASDAAEKAPESGGGGEPQAPLVSASV